MMIMWLAIVGLLGLVTPGFGQGVPLGNTVSYKMNWAGTVRRQSAYFAPNGQLFSSMLNGSNEVVGTSTRIDGPTARNRFTLVEAGTARRMKCDAQSSARSVSGGVELLTQTRCDLYSDILFHSSVSIRVAGGGCQVSLAEWTSRNPEKSRTDSFECVVQSGNRLKAGRN